MPYSASSEEIHHLSQVFLDFKIMANWLESGERLEPAEVQKIVQQLKKSLELLDQYIQKLKHV